MRCRDCKSDLVIWWVRYQSNIYMEISFGANPKRVKTWEPMISNIEKKLSLWKSNLLSRAGRLVLIKAVLNNLPLYYLELFPMPKTVAKKIISLQTRFLWGKNSKGGCIPTVKWSQIQLPKE